VYLVAKQASAELKELYEYLMERGMMDDAKYVSAFLDQALFSQLLVTNSIYSEATAVLG